MAESKKLYLTAEDFLAGVAITPEDFDGPIGRVSLRGLTTLEVNHVRKLAQADEVNFFAQVLITGMEYPKLDASAADKLVNGSFGRIFPYIQRIQALSGMATNKDEAENLDSLPGGGS